MNSASRVSKKNVQRSKMWPWTWIQTQTKFCKMQLLSWISLFFKGEQEMWFWKREKRHQSALGICILYFFRWKEPYTLNLSLSFLELWWGRSIVGRICVLGSHWYRLCLCLCSHWQRAWWNILRLIYISREWLPFRWIKESKARRKAILCSLILKLLFLAISLLCISSFGWIFKVQMIIQLGWESSTLSGQLHL